MRLPIPAALLIIAALAFPWARAGAFPERLSVKDLDLSKVRAGFGEAFSFTTPQPAEGQPLALPLDPARIKGLERIQGVKEPDRLRETLAKQGFAVLEDESNILLDLYSKNRAEGIAHLITTDSLLSILPSLIDGVLGDYEIKTGATIARTILRGLRVDAQMAYQDLTGDLKEAARYNMAYFSVALQAVETDTETPEPISELVKGEIERIAKGGGVAFSPLLRREVDYTIFEPPGHYASSDDLKRYWVLLTWISRMPLLYQEDPSIRFSRQDADLQTLQAALIASRLDTAMEGGTSLVNIWATLSMVYRLMWGSGPGPDLLDMREALRQVMGEEFATADLADRDKLHRLQEILREVRRGDLPGLPLGALGTALHAPGLRLLNLPPEHPPLLARLVHPAVGPAPTKTSPLTSLESSGAIVRALPRSLDALAVFGAPQALEVLEQEGDMAFAGLKEILKVCQDEMASLPTENRRRNLPWLWAELAGLAARPYRLSLLPATASPAWRLRSLEGATAAWVASTNRDANVYPKIGGTISKLVINNRQAVPGAVLEMPRSVLKHLHQTLSGLRQALTGLMAWRGDTAGRLMTLERLLGDLDQAAGEAEKGMMSPRLAQTLRDFDLALVALLHDLSPEALDSRVAVVLGRSLDGSEEMVAGVGPMRRMVVVVPQPDGSLDLAAGPVMTAYEARVKAGEVRSDQAWRTLFATANPPKRVSWGR